MQEVCDHILMLHHGRLVADGTPEELERSLRDNALEVTLRTSSENAVRGLLAGIDGISRTEISPTTDGFQAVVYAEGDRDLREAIFHSCAAADLPLIGMQFRTAGLEQVFLKLVNDETMPSEQADLSQSEAPGNEERQDPEGPVDLQDAQSSEETAGPESKEKDGDEA